MNTKLIIRVFIFALLVIAITWGTLNKDNLDPASLQSMLKNTGYAAPLFFMLTYIVSTIFFLPGSVLTLLGGALFGPLFGTFYSLTAATLGAMASFLISRYLASDWVSQKAAGRTQQLIRGVENEGWRFVAFTRLVPLFPFNLLNYAFGLTRISFSQYSIATYIFMLPGALAYTCLGYIGKEAATGGDNLIQKAMLALALLAIIAFLPRLIQLFRNVDYIDVEELKSQLDTGSNILLLDVRNEIDFNGKQGHISGAISLPLEQLKQRINELKAYRSIPVFTICRMDKRSGTAAKILSGSGFENVKVVRMGMTDWNRHNYPVSQ